MPCPCALIVVVCALSWSALVCRLVLFCCSCLFLLTLTWATCSSPPASAGVFRRAIPSPRSRRSSGMRRRPSPRSSRGPWRSSLRAARCCWCGPRRNRRPAGPTRRPARSRPPPPHPLPRGPEHGTDATSWRRHHRHKLRDRHHADHRASALVALAVAARVGGDGVELLVYRLAATRECGLRLARRPFRRRLAGRPARSACLGSCGHCLSCRETPSPYPGLSLVAAGPQRGGGRGRGAGAGVVGARNDRTGAGGVALLGAEHHERRAVALDFPRAAAGAAPLPRHLIPFHE